MPVCSPIESEGGCADPTFSLAFVVGSSVDVGHSDWGEVKSQKCFSLHFSHC